jgi:two-component SAPR family response regulator
MAEGGASLAGKRILVVEDEFVIALEVEGLLEALACEVVGPVASVRQALDTLEKTTVDGAVLDVHLRDGPVYPVVDVLSTRSIPYVLVTGYGAEAVRPDLRQQPRLGKPVQQSELEHVARRLFAGDPG